MRVFGYLGLLAVIVIIAILAVHMLKGISATGIDVGEQKAVKQLNAPGDDEKIDPKGEMQDTVRDALGH